MRETRPGWDVLAGHRPRGPRASLIQLELQGLVWRSVALALELDVGRLFMQNQKEKQNTIERSAGYREDINLKKADSHQQKG